MKNIVVGIDFSKNSINALKHAVAISIKSGAKLHLVWVKKNSDTLVFDDASNNKVLTTAQAKLSELVAACNAESSSCNAQSVILEGKVPYEISTYASNLPESMIVMGTHGISGFEEFFVGTNAYKTINIATVPVLILREGITIKRDLTDILVPIDTSFETLQKMKSAINFAKMFAAKIILVGIVSPVNSDTKHIINVQLTHAGAMCKKANVRFDTTVIDITTSPTKTIIEFAKKIEANLMVIMREEEEDLSSFFLSSETRQLVNNVPIPLLIIPNFNHFLVTK